MSPGGTKRWRSAVAASLMMVASLAVVAWLQARPQPGAAEVAAIFPPWVAREQALLRIAAADGVVVRQGAFDSVFVVHGGGAGFINRLYAAGAWAVVDPVAFGGCLVKRPVVSA